MYNENKQRKLSLIISTSATLIMSVILLLFCNKNQPLDTHSVNYYKNNSITSVETDTENIPKYFSFVRTLNTDESYSELEKILSTWSKMGYGLYEISNDENLFLIVVNKNYETQKYEYLIRHADFKNGIDTTFENSISSNINDRVNAGYELIDSFVDKQNSLIYLFYRKPLGEDNEVNS